MNRMTERDESDFLGQSFHENEVRHNRLSSIAVLILGIVYTVMHILNRLGLYDLISETIGTILMVNGLVNILVYVICRRLKFDSSFLKVLIIITIMISAGIDFFFYPLNSSFIMYSPVIIAALYYDTALTRIIALLSWILYSILLWLNVILEEISPAMQNFHAVEQVTLWKLPNEVLLYRFIPHTILFFITMYICTEIARSGKKLIFRSAEEISRGAVIRAELSAASDMQQSSLPDRSFTDLDGRLRINAVMKPAKTVGGDFYDYFYLGDSIVVLIADVSDKGLPAAMFMMKAKNAIRAEITGDRSLEESMSAVNSRLAGDNREDMFVTLWVACINVRTGAGRYVNCGHDAPFIISADGKVSGVKNDPDIVLGVFRDTVYRSHPVMLGRGDRLLLYTDGLTDALDSAGESFGVNRLRETLASLPDDGDLCGSLIGRIDGFSSGAGQFDDMTALCLSVTPENDPLRESVTLEAGYGSGEAIIDRVNAMLGKVSCPEDTRRNIDVVIDEICTNIADYAYPGGKGDMTLDAEIGGNYAVLTFSDSGARFNPAAYEAEKAPGDEIRAGGLGISLVRELADELTYARTDGRNVLRIKKIWT